MVISDSRAATAAVEAGDADVGFVGERPGSGSLKATPVAQDELALVVGAKHPWAKKGSATLKQLREESMIVREPGSASRRCVERALEECGTAPADLSISMEVNNNGAIRAAVERGAGVAFLSMREDRQNVGLVRVKVRGFHPRRQLYMIRDARRMQRSPAREFLAFVERWRKGRGKTHR